MISKDNKQIAAHVINNLDYSFRRYFVDLFFLENISKLPSQALILDMGGKRKNKRGYFNIEDFDLRVKYANIDASSVPDYLCSITSIPEPDHTFDGVVLSETLEHVKDPVDVLREAQRVVKPGGTILICTPFNFHVHGDPYDYARYTSHWYQETLSEMGLLNISIRKQGGFFCVLANMLKFYVRELVASGKLKSGVRRWAYRKAVVWFAEKALCWDNDDFIKNNRILSGYTTGYEVICTKR